MVGALPLIQDSSGRTEGLGHIPAIDGLRAIAVLAVIAFHLRSTLFPGGLVGVDIFFVISGFVVTGSMAGRSFGSVGAMLGFFYRRRVVRIVPALVIMIVVTQLATILFVPENHTLEVIRSTGIAAAAGVSNLFLAWTGDSYFDPRQELNPFLHTWTLGVEEQFYLIFPWLLLLCRSGMAKKPPTRFGLVLLAALIAASGLLAGILHLVAPRSGFYLMPARFWELGAGMFLFLSRHIWQPVLNELPARLRSATAAMAFVLLAAALFIPFHYRLVLLPIGLAAAATIILVALVSSFPSSQLARLLGARLPVYLGKISYSLYLWHWPVIVLFTWTIGTEGAVKLLAAILLTFLLAAAAFHAVEQPLRRLGRRQATNLPVILLGVLALGATAAAVTGLHASRKAFSLSTFERERLVPFTSPSGNCALRFQRTHIGEASRTHFLADCPRSLDRGRLFVVGDSHAIAIDRMIGQLTMETGIEAVRISQPDCEYPPISGRMPFRGRCGRFYREVTAELERTLLPGDTLVMVSLRIPMHLGRQGDPRIYFREVAARRPAALAVSRRILQRLGRTGAMLVIEAPKPIFPSPPQRCLDWFNRSNPVCRGGFSTDRERARRLAAPAAATIVELRHAVPDLQVWDPFPVLCPGRTCSALDGRRALYTDTNHLSRTALVRLYPGFRGLVLEGQRRSAPNTNERD